MQGIGRTRFGAALIGTVLGAVLLVFAGTEAQPQSGETIRLILPFPPGGPADIMARVVAEQIGATGGPSMVIESHPGAATEIGTEYLYRSEPDGNTLGIISNSFVTLPHLRKLKYDPLTDFAPICDLADFPPLIAVNSTSPYHKLADLIDAAHAQPGKLTLGSIGPGSSSQMAFEMLKREAKANITFVPFTGYTPAIQALLGNQITSVIADLASLQGQTPERPIAGAGDNDSQTDRNPAGSADRHRVRLRCPTAIFRRRDRTGKNTEAKDRKFDQDFFCRALKAKRSGPSSSAMGIFRPAHAGRITPLFCAGITMITARSSRKPA